METVEPVGQTLDREAEDRYRAGYQNGHAVGFKAGLRKARDEAAATQPLDSKQLSEFREDFHLLVEAIVCIARRYGF